MSDSHIRQAGDQFLGSVSSDALISTPDGVLYGRREVVERINGVQLNDLRDEYVRGAVGVIVKFDVTAGRDMRDADHISSHSNESVSLHPHARRSVSVEGLERRVASCPQGGPNNAMLISNIKVVKSMECLSSPARKGLIPSKKVLYPGTGRLDAVNGAIEINPVVSAREHQMFILRAAIDSNNLPSDMIENASEVVDSIAYYDREGFRDRFDETNLDVWLSSLTIVCDSKSVWLTSYENFDLPFKVSNMMFCSFEL